MIRILILIFILVIPMLGIARFVSSQERQPPLLKGGKKPSATPSPVTGAPDRPQRDADEVERVETNLVTVPASVKDRVGRYITDLRKEDFQIFEDGVGQDVAVFAPVEQPFTILFLLDTSGSMVPHMNDLGRAANTFLSRLRPDDKLIAATFNDRVQVLGEEASVREVREGKKFRLRTGGRGTLIYDAIDDALQRMNKIRGRKSIVLFSDGFGAGTFSSAKDNLHKAEEQDALIYTVQFGTQPAEPPSYVSRKEYFRRIEEANGYMKSLAQKTGGRHYRIENISDLAKTFGFVADELRRQYSLSYYPKKRPNANQTRT
ncbi:MAG TPA: VWA domain-containing protein, partial [Pyrinomonadaceae bacterium]